MTHVMSTPRSADIAITGRCNLDCRYCFYADEMVARGDLTTEQWYDVFDELGELGLMTVTLTGGEVFTRPDLFQLIDRVIDNRMRYSLLTNGTAIVDKTMTQFLQGKRRQRLDSIQISIDGSTPEIHSLTRPTSLGADSFHFAIRGIRLLLAHDFPVTVRMTINRHNLHDIENIVVMLLDDIGVPHISCNDAYTCGETDRSETAANDVVLTPEQRIHAMQVIADLDARYPDRISASSGPLAMARQFKMVESLTAEGETSYPDERFGVLGACGCTQSKLSILHDGTIVSCHVLSSLPLGKMGQDKFKDVWHNHDLLKKMRHRHETPLSTLETCKDCEFQGFCTGGCPGIPFHLEGTMDARNPLDCYRLHRRAMDQMSTASKSEIKPPVIIPIVQESKINA